MSPIDADKLIEDIHKRSYISKALSEIFETIIDEQPIIFGMLGKDIDKLTVTDVRNKAIDDFVKAVGMQGLSLLMICLNWKSLQSR